MTVRLFVADDSATIHKVVGLAFGGEDVEIETAAEGGGVLDAVRVFKPHIVLADVFMPGMRGYEICERMKNDPELADVPVVLLAGTFEPFDKDEAVRVGCDGWLTKPFDTAELVEIVHRLVEGSEGLRSPDAPPVQARPAVRLAGRAAIDSFLGKERVLDLFDERTLGLAGASRLSPEEPLSDDLLKAIVEQVVRRMSADVIREVAWEVVPELSESIIRSVVDAKR